MSWTDIYPILTDEMIEAFRVQSTLEERYFLDQQFAIQRVINKRDTGHVVATSLFWKATRIENEDLPPLNREVLLNAKALGLVDRFEPWKHYVKPLLKASSIVMERRPDITLRVYLASDLDFLIPDLVDVGCEVVLMKSSSLRHNPGAMWRFLALEEMDKLVTIVDSDKGSLVIHDIERTETLRSNNMRGWRVPYGAQQPNGEVSLDPGKYRPIIASNLGAIGGWNMREMMMAFIWNVNRGSIADECSIEFADTQLRFRIYGSEWPTYGFDEYFLLCSLYPRIASEGVMTLCDANMGNAALLAMDIEYVTWANARSELVLFSPIANTDERREFLSILKRRNELRPVHADLGDRDESESHC